jgi:hypothetical protein
VVSQHSAGAVYFFTCSVVQWPWAHISQGTVLFPDVLCCAVLCPPFPRPLIAASITTQPAGPSFLPTRLLSYAVLCKLV